MKLDHENIVTFSLKLHRDVLAAVKVSAVKNRRSQRAEIETILDAGTRDTYKKHLEEQAKAGKRARRYVSIEPAEE